MRTIPLRFCVFALSFLALNAAGLVWIRQELVTQKTTVFPVPAGTAVRTLEVNLPPLRIVAFEPDEDIDEAERLSLVFDRDVGARAELNQRLDDEDDPFLITPPVQGHWNWSSEKQLDFVLDQPLPAGRNFKVTPARNIARVLGQAVQVSGELVFETRALELKEARLVSADRQDVTFELKFNQKVDPQTLLKHLTIGKQKSADSSASRDRMPQSLVEGPAESIVVRCARPHGDVLKVHLAEELAGAGAERSLGKSVERSLSLPGVFTFLRAAVEEESIDGDYQVQLLMTSGLGEQALPALKVTPAVPELRSALGTHWNVDGRVIELTGRFKPGLRYEVVLPKTLLSVDNKPLGEDETVDFEIPGPYRRPRVEFAQESGILSPQGNLLLDLQTVNVEQVTFRAQRVHANNLVPHLHSEWQSWTRRNLAEKTINIDAAENETVTQAVELRGLIDQKAGLFRIEADAVDEDWVRGETLVTITDLALSLRQSPTELLVWVTSLRSGRPVEGVTVRSLSSNNQKLANAATDANGLARLTVDPWHPDGRPWVIVAEKQDELTWLKTDERHWVLDDIDQSGRPHPQSLDVMLFTERGTYRPGDAVHLTGIVRDRLGQVPPAFPVTVHVVRPDGSEVTTQTVSSVDGGAGLYHFAWTSADDAWTGRWQFKMTLPGSEEVLASTVVFIEEFLPVRMDVAATVDRTLVTGDQIPQLEVTSRYLFGGATADLPFAVETRYATERFQSKSYPAFRFGPQTLNATFDAGQQDGRLDANGRTQMPLALPDAARKLRWRGSTNVTVTEDGGRSVSSRASFLVDHLNRHIGLRLAGDEYASVGSPTNIEWLVRTADDQPAAFEPLKLELFRVQWDNTLRRVNGSTVWESIERKTLIGTQSLETAPSTNAGPNKDIGRAEFICPQTGWYRVVATHAGSGSITELDFFAAGNGSDRRTLALNRPERLEVKLDRSTCLPGETVQAAVTSPFKGTLLLCLEADRVAWSQVVELTDSTITIPVKVPEDIRGGAFLSATVLRAVDPERDDWLPHRAYGAARLMTDHAARRLPVRIEAPVSAEPSGAVAVDVVAEPGALIQLWAVDEGILLTSAYRTPDAMSHFYGPRSNGVTTSDIFADLLPDHRRPAGMRRIGGDGPGDELDGLTRDPVPAKKREAVVLWSSFEKADANGRLRRKVTLPNFTGELRWMAIGVDGDRYGSASQPMRVTTPLLAEAAWPRFASPADQFTVPVRVFNNTAAAQLVSVAVTLSGPALAESTEPAQEIPAGGSRIVWIKTTATGVGLVEGTVTATAVPVSASNATAASDSAPNGSASVKPFEVAFSFPVRPATARDTERRFVTVKAGESLPLTAPERFLKGSTRTVVTISADAGVELQPVLDELLQYPYGCLEQTSSRLRGLLVAGDWLEQQAEQNAEQNKDNGRASKRSRMVEDMLSAGITRVWSMQCRSGGLAYWPGSAEPDVWASAWATETLLMARDENITVDQRLLDGLRDFLLETLRRSDEDRLSLNTKAYLCHLLSRLGQPETGWMSLLSERVQELDMSGRAHLALAWHHAGKREQALAALPEDTVGLRYEGNGTDWHSSAVTHKARLLKALLEMDAAHPWVMRLVAELKQARRGQVWMSTLENALALEALLAWQHRGQQAEPFNGTVRIGERSVTLAPGQTRRMELTDQELSSVAKIEAAGSGQVFVSVNVTGLTNEMPAPVDRGIEVRRRWLDRAGEPIDPQRIRVGDLVFVEVTLKSTGPGRYENVAIVDALPTGLEVENPHLETSAQAADSADADHALFQDDRVILFATADPRGDERPFRYALRAVTEGQFTLPPIEAASMYDRDVSSIHGTGSVRVLPVNTKPASGPLAEDPSKPVRK